MKNFILIKRVVIALIAISLFFIGAGSGVFMSLKYRNIIPVAQRINAQEDIYVGEVNGLFEDAEKEVLGVGVDFDLFWEVSIMP